MPYHLKYALVLYDSLCMYVTRFVAIAPCTESMIIKAGGQYKNVQIYKMYKIQNCDLLAVAVVISYTVTPVFFLIGLLIF